MGERLKIFAVVALLGFIAGVVAQLFAEYAVPWIMTVLPGILEAKFLLSGLAGSVLTVAMVSVWAYFSGTRDR
ncbi:MAG: hypothetical protein NWF04_01135 [Candidatus Bathyarchaeota archaeon]|nr:hypothetical protein [Candidatus Bathyarchaeota archaeon]